MQGAVRGQLLLSLKYYVVKVAYGAQKLGFTLVAGEENTLTSVACVGKEHCQHIFCPHIVKE